MIVLIGSSPSSGSTLLADLLDSSRYSACGIELGLFSGKKIYSFPSYKRTPKKSSSVSSIYLRRAGVDLGRLYSYGLNQQEFEELLLNSKTLHDFANNFAEHFIALRGKNTNAVVFEKTPQNINCLNEFLKNFPESYFIYLARNPLFVFPSLLKRGFPPFVALATWLIDVSKYMKYKDNNRIILLKYEDLISSPFKITTEIIKKITDHEVNPLELKKNYETNQYRKQHSKKIKSWTISDFGKVGDANKKKLTEMELNLFSRLWNIRVSTNYAKRFDLEPVSFTEAVSSLGYKDSLNRIIPPTNEYPTVNKDDLKYLFRKWLVDFRHRDSNFSDLPIYLKPIEKITSCAE